MKRKVETFNWFKVHLLFKIYWSNEVTLKKERETETGRGCTFNPRNSLAEISECVYLEGELKINYHN